MVIFNNFIICWRNIQALASFDLCTGATGSSNSILMCPFWFPPTNFTLQFIFYPLLILFDYNKHLEIHKSPGSPEILLIQLISSPQPPGSSRIVVVTSNFLGNGLRPPTSHFRPPGIHTVWQEVLYLSYKFFLKAIQTIKTSWDRMPY